MGKVWVRDKCNCEDYPCCGHSMEEYLMDEADAEECRRCGEITILAKWHPEEFIDDDRYSEW